MKFKRAQASAEENMDEKDIGFSLAKWLATNQNTIYASLVAVIMSFLRIAYDYSNGTKKRTWLATTTEALLCGAITLSMASCLELFGLPATAATVVGGGVGFFGVDKLREFAYSWLEKKKPKPEDQPPAL